MNSENDAIEIDQKKLKYMCARIILLEKENTKTKQFGDREMRTKIREIIEGEIKKHVI